MSCQDPASVVIPKEHLELFRLTLVSGKSEADSRSGAERRDQR